MIIRLNEEVVLNQAPVVKHLIYDYEYGSYEGSGDACLITDDKIGFCCLGHCSCYGPEDGFAAEGIKWYTYEEYAKQPIYDVSCSERLLEYVHLVLEDKIVLFDELQHFLFNNSLITAQKASHGLHRFKYDDIDELCLKPPELNMKPITEEEAKKFKLETL